MSCCAVETEPMGKARARDTIHEGHARRLAMAQLPEVVEWLLTQGEGYPSISVVERILRDPGFATVRDHRALHQWPPARLQVTHSAFIRLPRMSQRALLLRYGWYRHHDGREVTEQDRADETGVSVRAWRRLLGRSRDLLVEEVRAIA